MVCGACGGNHKINDALCVYLGTLDLGICYARMQYIFETNPELKQYVQ